jgi:dihydropteroate synthase
MEKEPAPFCPRKRYSIPLPNGSALELGERTLVMGILNVTPDSFADGGLRIDPARAIDDGLRMLDDGADILDIGGESTRPGADPLPVEEELRRVLPVVEGLAPLTRQPLAVDTYKAVVAREAIDRGAQIINDVSGLQYDHGLAAVVAGTGAALVLMHNRGRSRTMYEQAAYADLPREIGNELDEAIGRAVKAGVDRNAIVIDPGLGFAKRAEHSYSALAALCTLRYLDRPILSGPSRKSFLKAAVGDCAPGEREWATAAAVAASILLGAHIVRVHGVREMVHVTRVTDRICAAVSA